MHFFSKFNQSPMVVNSHIMQIYITNENLKIIIYLKIEDLMKAENLAVSQ